MGNDLERSRKYEDGVSPNTVKTQFMGENEYLKYSCTQMTGWRDNQEDTVILEPDLGNGVSLFGVFDGHGGPIVSNFVKDHFKKVLVSNGSFKRQDYKQALRETFIKMDKLLLSKKGTKDILQKLNPEFQISDIDLTFQNQGCTANVILITPNDLFCANAGDSRSVMSVNQKSVICQNGIKTINLSIDHKPNHTEELKRIEACGGQVINNRVDGNLAMSRVIGDFSYKEPSAPKNSHYQWYLQNHMVTAVPDIKQYSFNQNQINYLILATDGIWDCLSSQQVVQNFSHIKNKKTIPHSIEQLQYLNTKLMDRICPKSIEKLELQNGRGADNMTICTLQIKSYGIDQIIE